MDVAPDGFNRPVIAVNGQHPSPLIRANKGDNFDLTVVNSLEDPTMLRQTSIHWHGMFQRTTAWADGADGATKQGRIGIIHTLALNTVMVFVALVIYDQDDPHQDRYDVDDESTIITLADCDWSGTTNKLLPSVAQLSDATLINGKGRAPGGPATPIEIVNVTQELATPTEPHTVQEIQIFAAILLILEANQEPSNYWIRAIPNVGRGTLPNVSGGGINSAILSAPANPIALQESNLRSLIDPAAPGGSGPAQENVLFTLGLAGGRFTMNGASWVSPDSPVLVQIMNGVPAADVFPRLLCAHYKEMRWLKSQFRVLLLRVHIPSISMVMRPNDNVTIRFTTDNPGPWFFHWGLNQSHIEFHLVAGLAMVFLEAPEDIPSTINPPVEWDQLCPKYDSLPASATSIQTVPTPTPF
ncbi:laccase 10 [Coprinopsis sp. MPI-PUGE-AT-0042]|nr:laccase 10 [Coprinopsis sp. MPI-PUGE-AT-0042]